MTKRVLYSLFVCLAVTMALTGFVAATTTSAFAGSVVDNSSVGTVSWSNPSNATISDDNRANATLNTGITSHYIKATNFGFSIPAGATIEGIQAVVEADGDSGNKIHDSSVRLIKNDAILSTSEKASATAWNNGDLNRTYGSASLMDLWSQTWSASDINNANFGFAIAANSSANSKLAQVDAITLIINFTPDTLPPAGGSITYSPGFYTTASVPITYATGSDSGAGLNTSSGKIQRASATMTNGVCGSFGSFTDLVFETDGSYTDAAVASGNCYEYQYAISDNVGNSVNYTSANVVKVDTNAPTLSSVSIASNNANPSLAKVGDTVTLTFTASEALMGNASVTIDGHNASVSNSSSTSWSATYVLVSGDTEGSVTFNIAFNDLAGNAGTAVTGTTDASGVTFDKTAPTLLEVTPVSTPTNETTPSYTFSSDEAGTISYTGSCSSATTSASAGSNVLTLDSLSDGTYADCQIVVTDAAGNPSATLTASSFTIDTTAPVLGVTNPASGASVNDSATFFFSDSELTNALCSADGSTFTACTTGDAFGTLGGFSGLSDGPFTLTIQDTDATGNTGTATEIFIKDTDAPVIDVHGDELEEATSAAGAIVTYSAPATNDAIDGSGTASCAPVSGTLFALGTTLVTCDASDAAGNAATSTFFNVTVQDTTAPVISGTPSDMIVEATSASGAQVNFSDPTALDIVDGAVTPVCLPASGSTFFLGETNVTCVATDAPSNQAASTFLVTVQDTTAPAFSGVTDITLEATGAATAVTYSLTANDLVDGAITPICTPADGSSFPVGTTAVNCTASDSSNQSSTADFNVTITDTTAPVIDGHGDEVAEATSASGATVSYAAPTAQDLVDGNFSATCAPASGSTFALGSTVVTCDAQDSAGNNASSTTFNVTVSDTTAPTVDAVSDITAEATSASGAFVIITAPTSHDAVDGDVVSTCDQVTGTFPIGTTPVSCGITDANGNTATNSTFNVLVQDTTAPLIAAHGNVTTEAAASSGANVSYSAPATSDDVDGASTATCLPASGSTFALGNATVTCNAQDAAGNNASSTTFTVTVSDTIAPVLVISSPSNGSTLNSLAGLSLAGSVTDATLVTLTSDDAHWATTLGVNGGFVLSNVTDVAEGAYLVTLTATDAGSNTATATVSFTVDNTRPSVSIFAPINGTSINALAGLTINGSASDNTSLSLASSNAAWAGLGSVSGVFALDNVTDLPEGAYSVTLTATDAAANTASAQVDFTVDNTPPAIAISAPVLNDSFLALEGLEINGTSDASSVDIWTNDSTWSAHGSGAAFDLANTTEVAEGNYTVRVFTKDSAGNTNSSDVSFEVFRPAPTVSIGQASGIVGANNLGISGSATNGSVVTASGGSSSPVVSQSGGSWNSVISLGSDAAFTVTVTATQNWKNATAAITLVRDTTAPNFTAVSSTGLGVNIATLTWNTDGSATTQVLYGTASGSYPLSSSEDVALSGSHSVSFSTLSGGTPYFFVARSCDHVDYGVRNCANSSENTFTTLSSSGTGGGGSTSGAGGFIPAAAPTIAPTPAPTAAPSEPPAPTAAPTAAPSTPANGGNAGNGNAAGNGPGAGTGLVTGGSASPAPGGITGLVTGNNGPGGLTGLVTGVGNWFSGVFNGIGSFFGGIWNFFFPSH